MHEHWKPTSEHLLRLASLRYLARYLTRYVQAELLTLKPRQLFLLSRVPVEAKSAAKFIRGHVLGEELAFIYCHLLFG